MLLGAGAGAGAAGAVIAAAAAAKLLLLLLLLPAPLPPPPAHRPKLPPPAPAVVCKDAHSAETRGTVLLLGLESLSPPPIRDPSRRGQQQPSRAKTRTAPRLAARSCSWARCPHKAGAAEQRLGGEGDVVREISAAGSAGAHRPATRTAPGWIVKQGKGECWTYRVITDANTAFAGDGKEAEKAC